MDNLNLNGVFGTFSIFPLDRHALATEVLPYSANPDWRYQRRACKNVRKGPESKFAHHERVHLFLMCDVFKDLAQMFWIYGNLWVLVSNMSMAMAVIRQPGNSSSLIT